jgi:hypothetical protein
MRAYLAGAALVLLAACAHASTAPAPSASATVAADTGRIGYVRMDDLVKKHPLYGQLAQIDDSIAALDLSTLAPSAVAAGPQLAQEEARLNAQLNAAAKRTNDVLQAKGQQYQARENAAIAAALAAAGTPSGPSVGDVRNQMESTGAAQVAGVDAQAAKNLDDYQRQLEAQDRAQVDALQQTLAARADRTYRARAEEFTAKEAALSLKLANDDAAERLSLRTKLTSLALDDAARDDANKALAALDAREADALAAQRNTDGQQLATLQQQLRDQIAAQMQKEVPAIHARSVARYQERAVQLHQQFAAQNGPLIVSNVNGRPVETVNPNLPPDLRRRIAKLHADYTSAYQNDAKSTIADFQKTRADLSRRYAELHGTDVASAQGAQAEMAALQKKRADLYGEMVAQIGREVKTIAAQRGISVVVSDVAAPAGGIDLTDDAMKDIETLHE